MRAVAALLAAVGLALAADGGWMQAKAGLAQLLLERAFVAAQATGAAVRPWPWADTRPVARIGPRRRPRPPPASRRGPPGPKASDSPEPLSSTPAGPLRYLVHAELVEGEAAPRL